MTELTISWLHIENYLDEQDLLLDDGERELVLEAIQRSIEKQYYNNYNKFQKNIRRD